MDLSTNSEKQVNPGGNALVMDVSAAPDPQFIAPAEGEPLLQLRAIANPGDPELQRDHLKIFLTHDAAVQVQALLRLEEGDTALDILYPPGAPNWAVRIENLPDTGTRFTRMDASTLSLNDEHVDLTAEEARALADRMDAAMQERQVYSDEVNEGGDVEGQGSRNDPTKVDPTAEE